MKNNTGNNGNYIWEYAANEVIPDFSDVARCPTYMGCKKILRERTSQGSKILFYQPRANHFRHDAEGEFEEDIKRMKEGGDQVSILVIGAGIQLQFYNDTSSPDIFPGHPVTKPVADFKFRKDAEIFLRMLNDRKLPATFRGDLTWRTAQAIGYEHGISLGCPSLLINPSVNLGQILRRKYQALKDRIGDRALRVALNVQWWDSPKTMAMSYRILDDYPNAVVYAQSPREVAYLAKNGIPFNRTRLYVRAEEWIESLQTMDVSIGVRFHGNMAALAAEIPVLTIAFDYRMLELVQRMHIPHITGFDLGLAENFDVADLVSSVNIDAEAFDRNRCTTARSYWNLFRRYGLKVKNPISAIGDACE